MIVGLSGYVIVRRCNSYLKISGIDFHEPFITEPVPSVKIYNATSLQQTFLGRHRMAAVERLHI